MLTYFSSVRSASRVFALAFKLVEIVLVSLGVVGRPNELTFSMSLIEVRASIAFPLVLLFPDSLSFLKLFLKLLSSRLGKSLVVIFEISDKLSATFQRGTNFCQSYRRFALLKHFFLIIGH